MIITINTKGVKIDVSMSQELTALMETKKGFVLTNNIKSVSIQNHHQLGESVRLLDKDNNEYWTSVLVLTSVNGVSNISNNDDLFDIITNAIMGN